MYTLFQPTVALAAVGALFLLFTGSASASASPLRLNGVFGNDYIIRQQRIPVDPGKAYRLRSRYAYRYGPYGEHFINTVKERQKSIPSTLHSARYPHLTAQAHRGRR